MQDPILRGKEVSAIKFECVCQPAVRRSTTVSTKQQQGSG